MAITLGTNLPSIRTQASLSKVTLNLANTMEKLSSGVRINKASDDAAGLVISENMEAIIRRSDQAINNIETGASFLKVAEDSMVSISDHYQRINDLLENMANDTNDVTSRTAAVNEIIERLKEINRLANATDFNGQKMLNGEVGNIIIQIGTDSDEVSTLDISPALSDCRTSAMGTNLPYFLMPGAKILKTTTIDETEERYWDNVDFVYPNPDGKGGYLDQDGNEVTIDPDDYKDCFEPTNKHCRDYMAVVQTSINDISARRGLLGAYENRMDSALESLTSRTTSLKDAKGVYTDTDIAGTATALVNQQIMQQLNISMLSMANSLQQNALALLGG